MIVRVKEKLFTFLRECPAVVIGIITILTNIAIQGLTEKTLISSLGIGTVACVGEGIHQYLKARV